jgi:hypothetical protein
MNTWRKLLAISAVAVCGITSGSALAQNLILNPSFEAGLASWTPVGGTCTFEALSPPSTSAGAGGFTTPTPPDGAALLMTDAVAPGTCFLFQDVVVTSPVNTLTFAAGYNFAPLGGPAGDGCSVAIGVTTPAGQILAVGYSRGGGTSEPIAARGPTTFSTRPGSTVRVVILMNSCADGPVGVAADDFFLAAAAQPLSVPTLGEWTLLLLALLMAGVAARTLRPARRVA